MKTLALLRAERKDTLTEMSEILDLSIEEERDYTKDEEKRLSELEAIDVRLGKQIQLKERLEKESGESSDAKSSDSRAKDLGKDDKDVETRVEFVTPEPRKQWDSFAPFLESVIEASKPGHTRSSIDERLLNPDGLNKEQRAGLGLNEAVDSEGGFLVDQPLSEELLTKAFETGILFPRARQIPLSGRNTGIKINAVDDADRRSGSRWGGVTAGWTAEGGTGPSGRPKFRQIELNLNKLLGFVYATDEMLEDVAATAAIIQQSMSEEIAFLLDEAVFDGDGAGKPLGLLQSGAKIAVSRDTGNEISFDDIVRMETALWTRSDANAIYYANRRILPQLMGMTFKTTAGDQHPVFIQMNAGATQAPARFLMGRPILFTEHNKALGTEGDIVLCDMSQYLFAKKSGLKTAMSMHVRFLYEEQVFRFSFRADGTHSWDVPVRTAQDDADESPLITLAA